jgi:hypothetical protein
MSGWILVATAATATAPAPCRLSNVFGNHMVLQRTPQAASVWGFALPNTTVTTRSRTIFNTTSLSTVADSSGVWRQVLPPTPMAVVGQDLAFSCSTGERFGLTDVLFGDVHICGGTFFSLSSSSCRLSCPPPLQAFCLTPMPLTQSPNRPITHAHQARATCSSPLPRSGNKMDTTRQVRLQRRTVIRTSAP